MLNWLLFNICFTQILSQTKHKDVDTNDFIRVGNNYTCHEQDKVSNFFIKNDLKEFETDSLAGHKDDVYEMTMDEEISSDDISNISDDLSFYGTISDNEQDLDPEQDVSASHSEKVEEKDSISNEILFTDSNEELTEENTEFDSDSDLLEETNVSLPEPESLIGANTQFESQEQEESSPDVVEIDETSVVNSPTKTRPTIIDEDPEPTISFFGVPWNELIQMATIVTVVLVLFLIGLVCYRIFCHQRPLRHENVLTLMEHGDDAGLLLEEPVEDL